jgi:catechol 2,3-dioxygenase
VAILVPDRATLGGVFGRIAVANLPLGAADHNVSEALYLYDADGNGLEIYRDRPREKWPWYNGQIHMVTDPLDLPNLLAEGAARGEAEKPLPAATRIGHVHLQVGDLGLAERFYGGVLGFERTATMPSALFMAAGGYHHHIGANVWDSKNAPAAPAGMAGLVEFTIVLPTAVDVAAVEERARAAGIDTEADGDTVRVCDPWRNAIRLAPAKT